MASQIERYLAAFPKDSAKRAGRPGMCRVFGCRNEAAPRGDLCSKHSMRLWRFEKPLVAFFTQIRDRAARKKIVFTITLEEFLELVKDTGYEQKRGRSAASLHLDRKDALLGYEPGNLRVLNASENCAKAAEDKARRAAYVAAKIAGYHADHYTGDSPYPAHEEAAYWEEQAAYFESQSTHVPDDNQPF